MNLDESYETSRHAKPVRCPRCRRSSLTLLFDSPAEGMVCSHCHEKLTALRKDVVVLARNLGAAVRGNHKRKQPICPRCGHTTDILMFDSPMAGMVCSACHGDLVYFRQAVVGLIPEKA
jgi:ribosomal protein S27E